MNFKHVMLYALLLSSSFAHADSIGWGDPGQRQPSIPGFPNDPWEQQERSSSVRTIEDSVQRYFLDEDSFDLLSDYYIRSQLQGQRIKDVTIVASTERGQGRAALVLNGQSIESSKVIARQMGAYTFRVDSSANIVGQSLRSIQLSMQGRFYVEKVIFNVFENSGSNYPRPIPQPSSQVEVLRQQLGQRIQEEGGLELFRLFGLAQARLGQTVRRVTITARGQGLATLLVNNQQIGVQRIGYNSERITFELGSGSRIGQEIQALKIYLRGNMIIDEVSLEIESRNSRRDDGRRDDGRDHFPPHHRH